MLERTGRKGIVYQDSVQVGTVLSKILKWDDCMVQQTYPVYS